MSHGVGKCDGNCFKKMPFKWNRPTQSPNTSALPHPVHWDHIDIQNTMGQVSKERAVSFKAGLSPDQGDSSGTTQDSKGKFLRGYSQGFMEKWEPGIHPVPSKFPSCLPFCGGDKGIGAILEGGLCLFKGNTRDCLGLQRPYPFPVPHP